MMLLLSILISTSHGSNKFNFMDKFIQCPYDESACVNDINCDSSSMGRRAGYFCNKWPFYSGGFAECCDTNEEFYTCTHAVYSYETNNVFCDFWYITQEVNAGDLQLCDCKTNNKEYCTSWICTTITDYDFNAGEEERSAVIDKLLLPNQIEIFGVHQCGYFTDAILTQNNEPIPQYCYKYDDFKSCYCIPEEEGEDVGYCKNSICHKYLNNKKHDIDYDRDQDWNSTEYQNARINITNATILEKWTANYTSSAINILESSTEISYEEYECVSSYSNDEYPLTDPVDKTECTKWNGNLRFEGDKFSVMECGVEAWNADTSTFRDFDPNTRSQGYISLDLNNKNVTYDDLEASYSYKWICKESGMDYRNNKQFTNFYLSTLIWSIGVGFILLFLIRCYMRYKYITLSSFFCVQGWFFFIFGSIAAVHGGFVSFFIYFLLQFIIFGHVICVKCKNKGKQPYGSVQRYDFDPIDEDSQLGIKRNNNNGKNDDDDKL
mmetsp:Transcript_2407/g.2086  ORF Transcript_2407/g.2086 Transcript_2407/m.2086 type:complete len:493 (+) Transcript_2407:95-1573(+)